MGEQTIISERVGAVATITLNRPESYNALNLQHAEELLDALIACDEDQGIRAVVLTGAGRAFCSGGDIRAMNASTSTGGAAAFLKKLTVFLHSVVTTMAWMPKPVVVAVNGPAAGAGFSLALAADLVLAAEGATFTMAYTKIGLSPDGSSTYFLPRLVGVRRAFDLICSNRILTASQAQDLGLVADVFPDQEFQARAQEFAARLAAGPTQALARAKRLLNLGTHGSLETQMEHERAAIAECGRTEDFREGVRAFLEKGIPRFAGR